MADLSNIKRRKHPTSRAIRACVFTSNEYKKKEFQNFLGEQYGVVVTFADIGEPTKEDVIKLLETSESFTPHYFLREETKLLDPITRQVVDGREIVKNPGNAPTFLVHVSKVKVWVPQWTAVASIGERGISSDATPQTLVDVVENEFESANPGYIDPSKENERSEETFGWDHMFVNPRTGKTNQECINSRWSKNSARQISLSDFVGTYLFYKRPVSLQHYKELRPRIACDFSPEMSVEKFVADNQYFTNKNIDKWFTKNMLSFAFNEGVFFKSSTSRPVKNYFSPPFGGVPLTPKKCEVEETVFMAHDIGHHLVPDLIVNFSTPGHDPASIDSLVHLHVYVAWRMISEATTMIFADMFYADSLVTSDPDLEKGVDRRIFGLWKVLDMKKEGLNEEEKLALMKKIWFANVHYAVLGDESDFRGMITKDEKGEMGIKNFVNHFEKFFIGDHNWTRKNYSNMTKSDSSYSHWVDLVGAEVFEKKCDLFLLDDIVHKLQKGGSDLSTFSSVVDAVFEYIYEHRLKPAAQFDPNNLISAPERTGKAFMRYIVGNFSFYSKFYDLVGVPERFNALKEATLSSDLTNAEVRNNIRFQFESDIRYVWSMGCISTVAAANCASLTSIFPPFYIKYGYDQWKSTAEIVKDLYG